MRILRAADRKPSPWKNGGGVTWELAAFPEGSGLETFEWRISIAEVETDGPFSVFPGIDRVLTVIAGAGLMLNIQGQRPRELGPASAPLAFPGDVACDAALTDGTVRDFNVMTRRGRCRATVRRISGPAEADSSAKAIVVLALDEAQVGPYRLNQEDAVIAGPCTRLSLGHGRFLIAEIGPD